MKTRLQVAARVNYDVFTRYIDWMSEKGLVRYEDCSGWHEGIRLTTKGEEAYRKLVQWMSEVIHGRL